MRRFGTLLCLLGFVLLIPGTSDADSVVLTDGTVVGGTIIGRESAMPGRECPAQVSIVESSGRVREFQRDEIEYLVIDGSDGPRIIGVATDPAFHESGGKSKALLLVSVGAVAAVIGTTVPLGQETHLDMYGNVRTSRSWGDLNRVMAYGGLAAVLAGGIMSVWGGGGDSISEMPVAPCISPISGELGIAVCMRF